MLAITTIGQEIDFASLRTEPFSNVTHFKISPGRLRSMRITDWGERVMLMRRRLSSNYYDNSVVAARYTLGELVRPDRTSPDGWSAVPSAANPSRSIVAVTVFADPGPGQALYGRSWVKGNAEPEEFLQEILVGLR